MNGTDDRPKLEFFRDTPDRLMSRPPLCSSLQNLESCFMFIALDRFPHALVMCASAVESAMKAVLAVSSEQFIPAEKLFANATKLHPALSSFDDRELESFRFTRNRIVHYGFSPCDDEETVVLLLKTGFRFLSACYKEFFSFDLLGSLHGDFGDQLGIALSVYEKAKGMEGLRFSYCFLAFGHLIRWSARQSLMADWENDASIHAEEIGAKFEHCHKRKDQLERLLSTSWVFNCPICRDGDTFVCELDENRLENRVVALKRGECANCGFVVRKGYPFLLDALCKDQIHKKRDEILRDFGIPDL